MLPPRSVSYPWEARTPQSHPRGATSQGASPASGRSWHSASGPFGAPAPLSPPEDEPSFMVPLHPPTRDAVCTVPIKAEEELKDYSRPRTDDGTGRQYIEFLGLRLLLHPEKDGRGWKVEVESVLPQAVQFWDHHKGIRRGDVLISLDGREVANLDGAMLERFLFANRSAKGLRQLVFKRSPLNHLRWMRQGPAGSWNQAWDQGEPKVLSGVQRLAEDLRAEEERRRMMEHQTLLAQELAAKLVLSQESEREYVKAEAELFAAKNFREEKEDRMEALVEKMAWTTEETALEKLAHEHEVHVAEMNAEAETRKRKLDSGLQDFLTKVEKELEAMEEQEQQLLSTRQSLEVKVEAKRQALDATKAQIAKTTEVFDTIGQRYRFAEMRLEDFEDEAVKARGEEQVLESNLRAEETSAATLARENSKLQEQLSFFKLKSSKAMAEIDEEEGQAAWLRAQLLERRQGQEQVSQEMQAWYKTEEYQLELIQRQLDLDEKNMSREIDLLRNQEIRKSQEFQDQEMKEREYILEKMAFLEESAEGWKLEQQALLKGQELAEEAAEEAERQATEEAAKHLAEGKLVPGANLEVILTDPGPVGLTFYADDSEPPRVRKVKKDRREFWDKQGMKDGAAILAVGDTPTAKLTSAELLPLLNGRPLRLQFALDGGQGINGTDGSGQTALHKAMEAGDEAAALDILANPDFKAINMQDNLGKTALHWAASGGLGEACKAILSHPEFRSQDAVDYRGITAYEDAEAAGQMEVVKIFDSRNDDPEDDQEGW